MSLTKLTEDLNIISSLADQPSLTSTELKAKFDEAVGIIKTYLNNILTEEVDDALSDISASDVSYNNSTSGLTADDVQEALDELKGIIDALSFSAANISFNNSGTGMSATNVQSALAELKSGLNSLSGTADKKTVYSDFTTTRHTLYNGTLTTDQQIDTSVSISKSGYYPISIAGFHNTNTRWVDLYRLQLVDRTNGSAKISFQIKSTNGIDTVSETLNADVLWVKVR